MRFDGNITAFGLPVVRYTTEERLDEIIKLHEDNGCPIFNPHRYTLEEGGMKQSDPVQLAFKKEADPKGLLNPGKMIAWDEPDHDFGSDKIWLFPRTSGRQLTAMRVLVLFAHPVEDSYQAALHRTVVEALQKAGHEVDDCDLYAEGFNPVLSRDERKGYHAIDTNQAPVSDYVKRLQAAEALVLVFPVWNFGYPAILKGFFDRVFLPGVSFTIVDGKVRPCLDTIKKVTTVTTYGGSQLRAFLVGDPPRKCVMRVLRAVVGPVTPMRYLAHYDMNRSTDSTRATFLAKVAGHMAEF